jgi:hypothetical protein
MRDIRAIEEDDKPLGENALIPVKDAIERTCKVLKKLEELKDKGETYCSTDDFRDDDDLEVPLQEPEVPPSPVNVEANNPIAELTRSRVFWYTGVCWTVTALVAFLVVINNPTISTSPAQIAHVCLTAIVLYPLLATMWLSVYRLPGHLRTHWQWNRVVVWSISGMGYGVATNSIILLYLISVSERYDLIELFWPSTIWLAGWGGIAGLLATFVQWNKN